MTECHLWVSAFSFSANPPAARPFLAPMKNAPWWLISAGIHLVLLFGAALVFLETMFPFDDSAHVVMLSCSARPEGGITIDEPPPLEQIHGPWLRSPDPVTLQPGIWKEIDPSRPAREGASASAV